MTDLARGPRAVWFPAALAFAAAWAEVSRWERGGRGSAPKPADAKEIAAGGGVAEGNIEHGEPQEGKACRSYILAEVGLEGWSKCRGTVRVTIPPPPVPYPHVKRAV